jgi:hypothetical protein
LALERQNAERAIELTAEQVAFLEKLNPCFRERHVESGKPGELLSADTFPRRSADRRPLRGTDR